MRKWLWIAGGVGVLLVVLLLRIVYGVGATVTLGTAQWIGFGVMVLGVALTYLADIFMQKRPKEAQSVWWKAPGALLALLGAVMVFFNG